MKTLILVRGLPGSGKTSVAKLITSNNIAADDYFYNEGNGVYAWNEEMIVHAHKWCESETEKMMMEGRGLIAVHNTFTRGNDMKPYRKMAKENGYIVHTVIVENRHGFESLHNVSSNIMDTMEKDMMNNISIRHKSSRLPKVRVPKISTKVKKPNQQKLSFMDKKCFYIDRVTHNKLYQGKLLGICIGESINIHGDTVLHFDGEVLGFNWHYKKDAFIKI